MTKIEADIPTKRGDFGDHTYDGGMVVWGVKNASNLPPFFASALITNELAIENIKNIFFIFSPKVFYLYNQTTKAA